MNKVRKSTLMLALSAPLVLAACAAQPTAEVVTDRDKFFDGSDACNSAAYQQYVGQKSPQISLPAGTTMRDYRTGDPVTMDMQPERINFEYDRSGTLVRVSCG